jgi:hypothetical protein
MAGAKQLWAARAPLKHKMHLWLVLRNHLWPSDRLARRGLQHSPLCPLCCQEAETIEHLTIQCSYAREVWYHLLLARRLHRYTPLAHEEIPNWWRRLQEGTPGQERGERTGCLGRQGIVARTQCQDFRQSCCTTYGALQTDRGGV